VTGVEAKSEPTLVRPRADVIMLLVSLAVFGVCTVAALGSTVPVAETAAFRAVNDTVTLPFRPIWAVMQLGNVAVVPIAALAAAIARRFRLAISILVGGLLVYWLAKVVKDQVGRGRPGALLEDVVLRDSSPLGLGYVSGHAAVVTLIATVATPWLPRRWRWLPWTLAAAVCLARVYVGAHMPLDVVGGAALGIAVGAALRLLLGRPDA
jgi:undecaprenyl-diphosphatase